MTKQFVKDLREGDTIKSHFVVIKKESIQKYKNKQGFYFGVKLGDKTGDINFKFWGNDDDHMIKSMHSSFDERDVVQVTGYVSVYQGKNQITAKPGYGQITKTDNFEASDFLKTTTKDINEMKRKLQQIINDTNNVHIKLLLKDLFDDEHFMNRYANSPAAKSMHHNYVGGLLEHVLDMVEIAKTTAKSHQQLDLDLLICGCILHDIGKVEEINTSTSITYTTKGSLLGHIAIGYNMVEQRIQKFDLFPEYLAMKILHMILSHHGKLEWASPVTPKFPEAVALHNIDNLDAKVKSTIQIVENANTKDEWCHIPQKNESIFLR